MHVLQRLTRLIVITSCLLVAGVSCTQADVEKKNSATHPIDHSPQTTVMNPMMMGQMGQMNGMMNPHMYLNMMSQMQGMMNPQMMGMVNPMMMGGMGNLMSMNMMYPMMGQMMPGGIVMPNMGANFSNPNSQMPSQQMMDPKQYEKWFNQMTENMKNITKQTQAKP